VPEPQPQQPAAPVDEPDAGPAEPPYRDDDFVEADSNRDPFRSFAFMFKVHPMEAPQRAVIMATTNVDDMVLIAIVSGVTRPMAMVKDPSGVGHVVKRGDYVGRAEVVQTGGPEGMPATLNWRVDRIRPDALVLSREDPTAPNRPPLTRIIPLHEEDRE
jgi:type IV pilus assembly protein PilP